MDLEQLHQRQMKCFELAKQNFSSLQQAIYREIPFKNFSIRLQYNPVRIRSTNAKVDQATIQKRPCFLCRENMPKEQEGIAYANRYHIFVNPYPIFHHHFTVPTDAHTPQSIVPHLEDLWQLAFDFPNYTIFYNGPDCGASAPDHCHFQIAPRNQMPLEQDIDNPQLKKNLQQENRYCISILNNYLREVIILKVTDKTILSQLFIKIHNQLSLFTPQLNEPMMNLLCWFKKDTWTLCIFPRKLGRPKQFFAKGEEKILFSPGCVDMAGLIIAPRKEDFERYSIPLLFDLFKQVTLNQEQHNILIQNLKEITI